MMEEKQKLTHCLRTASVPPFRAWCKTSFLPQVRFLTDVNNVPGCFFDASMRIGAVLAPDPPFPPPHPD